jgi:FkbM family methyltransferase
MGVHPVAVRMHRMFGKRADISGLRDFYKQILPANPLVFDIGANVGIYADALESAGARVVAVEPNSDCVRHIELTYRNRRIEIVQAAVGPADGLVTFHVSDVHDDASTVCADVLPDGSKEAGPWNRATCVPAVKLDTLISHFGMPDYIKMDVEGYESFVLDGLSTQPALLSFEFHHLYADRAMKCLDKPIFGENSRFNLKGEEDAGFELSEWVSHDEIRRRAAKIGESKLYKDIYVRK